ncbi:ParB/RepB/Spo0J family partition protein [Calothrix sp. 336/3]|uniref:ParB/RepB/Spo0J family partition protein n=1 Tax=Calothrix sp. 336/3 TaxID=1337936 RepID=UPI0004E35728|nr:ParB N-terminal domain-containing protein [Calothrix sp. 336/3]AKG23067.1 plasmid partitioning protein ParB [Calothrix sp. 336/3]
MPIVPINNIKIGVNRRPLKDDKVVELRESIKTNGLLNPVTVDKNLQLIAGLHRLTACKFLGFQEIECHIVDYVDSDRARLAEIDENLIRNELEPLERADLWLEREELLQRLGLRAKSGDNQYTRKGDEMISPPKTNEELAKEVGFSKRTLQHGKQIAKSIAPEVKQAMRGTAIAKSTTELLKIARAGSQERAVAEAAEMASETAKSQGKELEAEKQAQLAAQARQKQQELQMLAFKSAMAQKQTKSDIKQLSHPSEVRLLPQRDNRVSLGEEWVLGRHLVYCGDTSSQEFRHLLPSNAALAIATLSSTWHHDYLIEEAQVVAVLRQPGNIYQFCRQQQMPFQYELIVDDIYLGVFSRQQLTAPNPSNLTGVESIITYLLNLYTSPNNFAIAPFMGNGEILAACERMGRICFIGDDNPQVVSRGITRWEKLTAKIAKNGSNGQVG